MSFAEPAANGPAASPTSWSGLYLGGHVGYGGASFGAGTHALPSQGVFFPHSPTGMLGGYQGGYNRQLGNGVVLGFETDVTFIAPLDRPPLVRGPFNTTF